MIRCQQCHAETQLYLCDNCQTQLANMLDQLPWLLDELDARIQKLDRIGVGTIGRNRRPDQMNVIDFDAADQARKVRKTLLHWVAQIAQHHTGRTPPSLTTVTTKNLARWLQANTDAIARLDLAHKNRHPLYDDIHRLVGTGEKGGDLIGAINRHQRHFAGPCPTIRGYHHNDPITCGTILYNDIDEKSVTCPACKQTIDVERNLLDARKQQDLHTEKRLLEILADETKYNDAPTVSRVKFYAWLKAGRIKPVQWLHNGKPIGFRIRRGDPALYSLARAQKLRQQEQSRQEAQAQ